MNNDILAMAERLPRPRWMTIGMACAILLAVASSPATANADAQRKMLDQLDQLDQLDRLDHEEFVALIDKATRCTGDRNFDCAEKSLAAAKKVAGNPKDKKSLLLAQTALGDERKALEAERRAEQQRIYEQEKRDQEQKEREEELAQQQEAEDRQAEKDREEAEDDERRARFAAKWKQDSDRFVRDTVAELSQNRQNIAAAQRRAELAAERERRNNEASMRDQQRRSSNADAMRQDQLRQQQEAEARRQEQQRQQRLAEERQQQKMAEEYRQRQLADARRQEQPAARQRTSDSKEDHGCWNTGPSSGIYVSSQPTASLCSGKCITVTVKNSSEGRIVSKVCIERGDGQSDDCGHIAVLPGGSNKYGGNGVGYTVKHFGSNKWQQDMTCAEE